MVTIPTIDQISGTTVMNKMRSLIRNYIDFAEEIANEMYTKEEIDIIVESIDTRISMKQDILISGTNIKTVDGKSLLGSGNVDIDFSNFYTKTQIDTLMASKQDLLISATNIKTINGNSILGSGDLQVTGDLSDYYTKSAIDTFLASKQDILVSGTNIKTVNGNSLLGSGNIQLGGASITLVGTANTISSASKNISIPGTFTRGDWFILEFNRVTFHYTIDGTASSGDVSTLVLINSNYNSYISLPATTNGIVLGSVSVNTSNISIILSRFIPATEGTTFNGISCWDASESIKLYKINV